MMLDKLRQPEQQPRSEYGGGKGRRMIGYDRNEPSPGRERSSPQMGGMPGREWEQPPIRMPDPGWGHPPMGMYGYDGALSFGGYGIPESRRRRDRRGRYMMDGADMDEDDDDKPRRKGGKMIAGAVWSDGGEYSKDWTVDEHKAMKWIGKMENPNGATGPHFKPELAEQLRAAHCPKCDRWEFLVALNMMYADYSEVAKKFAADKPEFYVCMAKAFLEDPDAGEGKLAKYMEIIPE